MSCIKQDDNFHTIVTCHYYKCKVRAIASVLFQILKYYITKRRVFTMLLILPSALLMLPMV